MNQPIKWERRGKVLSITLNRPDKKNSLTTEMYEELTRLFAQGDQDEEVAVIHITGSADSFCAGNDIRDFIAAAEQQREDSPARELLQQLHRQRKPVVAAVNGLAVGIGVTMLLHFDLVYAASDARFCLPFVDLGLVPEGGSSALLPQMLGHRRAAELLLLGKLFDASEAEKYGIINSEVSVDQLSAHSWNIANQLANKSAAALQQSKAMMRSNPGKLLEQVIDDEISQFMIYMAAEDAQTALRAFVGNS